MANYDYSIVDVNGRVYAKGFYSMAEARRYVTYVRRNFFPCAFLTAIAGGFARIRRLNVKTGRAMYFKIDCE